MQTGQFEKLIDKMLGDIDEQERSIAEAASVVTLDQTRVGRLSRMDALQSQAMHSESLRRLKIQKQALQRARQRIANDDFGYCDDCGEEIAVGRLEFNPAAELCIACAERAASRGS